MAGDAGDAAVPEDREEAAPASTGEISDEDFTWFQNEIIVQTQLLWGEGWKLLSDHQQLDAYHATCFRWLDTLSRRGVDLGAETRKVLQCMQEWVDGGALAQPVRGVDY